jgi:hypothetical protein
LITVHITLVNTKSRITPMIHRRYDRRPAEESGEEDSGFIALVDAVD